MLSRENVKSIIVEAFTEQSNTNEEVKPIHLSNYEQYEDNDSNIWNIIDKMSVKPPQCLRTSTIQKEINLYLNDEILNRNQCPLQWWKRNQHIYPKLHHIARKFLSLPA